MAHTGILGVVSCPSMWLSQTHHSVLGGGDYKLYLYIEMYGGEQTLANQYGLDIPDVKLDQLVWPR